jgi:hypothetical protein
VSEHEDDAPFAAAPDLDPVSDPVPVPERRGARQAFRHWRRTRPFWGAILVLAGGGEMLSLFYVPWKVVLHLGLYGISGYLVPILLCILGLSLLFDPQHRTFYSILSLLFSVASWMTSNLGGFMIGMIMAMTGASLAYGWAETPQGEEEEEGATPKQLSTS